MRKTVSFRRCESVEWPEAVQSKAKIENYQKPEFTVGSEEEARFVSVCREENVTNLSKTETWYCSASDVDAVQFFYLYPGNPGAPINTQFLDTSVGCNVKEGGCGKGVGQKQKIVLPQRKFPDISSMLHGGKTFLIVSKRLKDLLSDKGLQGLEFLPCLSDVETYSPEDYYLDAYNESTQHICRVLSTTCEK